jgi:nicotinate-nucleotide adenylyltransferase
MRRVALLGGSFNPPHIGHLLGAVYMKSVAGVDEVWLVPSFHHPFGKTLTDYAYRVEMCQAMANQYAPWLCVSQAESLVGKEGRTIDLLEFLLPQHPDTRFCLVIGSDILGDLPKWKAWHSIEAMVDVVVLHRAGFPSVRAVGPPLANVSSTEIRKSLQSGTVPSGLMPQGVVDCILRRGLFGFSLDEPR